MTTTHKIAGPPGTGKTTYLLSQVDKLLEDGADSKKIVFTTFTRAGAYEARDRAIARFDLTEASLPYFRTLHSICYRTVSQGRSLKPLNNFDWRALGKKLGLVFITWEGPTNLEKTDVQTTQFLSNSTKGNSMIAAIQMARNYRQSLKATYAEFSDSHLFTLRELEHLDNSIRQYKKDTGKVDYTDMLELFIKEAPELDVDYVIGDEMQDLTPLQWEVFNILAEQAKTAWIGADDDQAIYGFAGAQARLFIDAPGKLHVLDQSYRIPSSVHTLSQNIIRKVRVRIPKSYNPRDAVGSVTRSNIDALDMSKGKWLVLVRNTCFGDVVRAHCERCGWGYTGSGMPSVESSLRDSLRIWHRLNNGEVITGADLKTLASNLVREGIRYGFRKVIEALPDDDIFDLATVRKEYGLTAKGDWEEVMKTNTYEKNYLQTLERHGDLYTDPRIEISTIHNAKGRECENVAIIPDITRRTEQGFNEDPDNEHRCFYVGVTRAKENLVVLDPMTNTHYEI